MSKLDYVNIKQGTASVNRFSNGNTLPLTALPNALAAFAPQTSSSRGSWFYHPTDRAFEGIRLTHQPSPWIGDFSYFTFMPQSEKAYVSADARWSGFRPEDAELKPHYLKIKLLRYGAEICLAPTDDGAVIKMTYDDTVTVPRFAVTPSQFYGEIKIDEKNGEIYGFTTAKNACLKREPAYYFVFKFDCGLFDGCVTDGENVIGSKEFCGNAAGANVALDSKTVTVRLATSFISLEQARLNLSRIEKLSFEDARESAAKAWEDLLDKIEIEGDEEKKKTFYSCLYRVFLYPTKLYETDKDGKSVYVVPESGKLKNGVMYTNNGFWDTYRTVYPLFSLIASEKCREIVKAWLNVYEDTGYLPRWHSSTEIGCMPGTLIEAVLADAAVKGLLSDGDLKLALTAVLKNAEVQSSDVRQGRKCIADYQRLGFVPYDKCGESVNETLDCAYGDFCIGQIAFAAGEKDVAEKYYVRSKNYKNLFDSSVGFMRARNSEGVFRHDFDRFAWGRDYTEGSAYQTSVAVQHDVCGLADLYGGKEKCVEFLDGLVSCPPVYHIGGYGGEIHEMTEMAAADFGQCAISNQPSFHIPYMYGELGEKQKTVDLVKRLLTAFTSLDDGFPGDEDNGTMAAWYVFSALGFYPLCPGKAEYVVSESAFTKAVIHTDKDIDLIKLLKNKTKIAHSEFINKK